MTYNAPPPPPAASPYGQKPPENYLVWAILTTIFCCLPLGVVSIVFASQVNSKFIAGDLAGAQESSAKAKRWAIWSAVAGVVFTILAIIAYAVLIAFAVSSGEFDTTTY